MCNLADAVEFTAGYELGSWTFMGRMTKAYWLAEYNKGRR
jgi:hypothetical protein